MFELWDPILIQFVYYYLWWSSKRSRLFKHWRIRSKKWLGNLHGNTRSLLQYLSQYIYIPLQYLDYWCRWLLCLTKIKSTSTHNILSSKLCWVSTNRSRWKTSKTAHNLENSFRCLKHALPRKSMYWNCFVANKQTYFPVKSVLISVNKVQRFAGKYYGIVFVYLS